MHETYPATVGQLSLWRDLEKMPVERRWEVNLPFGWEVPAGHTNDEVWSALGALAMHHESLRTTYTSDADGTLRQQLRWHDPESVLAIARQGTADRGDEDKLADEQTQRAIDATIEPSWRAWILTDEDRPVRVLIIMHHVGSDGAGVLVLESDFTALLAGQALEPVMSPRDMALDQQGEGSTRLRSAERYWRRTLAAAPRQPAVAASAERFGATLHTGVPLPLAHDGAAKLDISLASLILAGYYRGVTDALGTPAVLMYPISSNRFDPQTARIVTTLVQWVPLLVDFDEGTSFEEIAQKLHWNSIKALKYGVCDPDAIVAIRDEFEAADPPVDQGFYYNPIIAPPGFPSSDTPQPAQTEWYVPARETGPGVYVIVRALTSIDVVVRANRAGFDRDSLKTCFASIQDALETAAGLR